MKLTSKFQGVRVLLYYCLVFTIVYGLLLLLMPLRDSISGNYLSALAVNIFLLALTLSLLLAIEGRSAIRLLTNRRGLLRSFTLSSGVIMALNLIAMGYWTLVRGTGLYSILRRMEELAEGYKVPWFGSVPPHLLPLAALVIWSVSGLFFFTLVQAYGIEKLGRRGVLLAVIVSSLLYNAPLLTGEWKPDDLLILCSIFPLVYWISGNSLGLMISYVTMFELPVAAAFTQGRGYTDFLLILGFRVVVGLLSLVSLPYMLKGQLGRVVVSPRVPAQS